MTAVPKKKPKAKSIKYYRNLADKLFQQYIQTQFKACFVCNDPKFTGHHYITKSASANLRYDIHNIIPLCPLKCHLKAHLNGRNSLIDAQIVKKKLKEWPGWVDYLEKNRLNNALKTNKAYYQQIIADLQEKLKQ